MVGIINDNINFRKMKNLILYLLILIPVFVFNSCQNQDIEFDDYNYSTVYFAYQTPVRTLVMGEDIFDTSLDNEHKCKIMATMGGVYSNKKNVLIDVSVDNSLCDGLLFKSDNSTVEAMPSSYYTLSSGQITLAKGSIIGGVEVHFTDAFFEDPLALKNHYVIPLVMTDVQNADSILSGSAKVSNPIKTHADDWDIVPKNYVLYAVKYINTWAGNYLKRGKDVVTSSGATTTTIRHKEYVEYDEVCSLTTNSLTKANYPLVYKDANGININVNLILTFDDNGNCTVSSGTTNATASGNGSFVKDGEVKSWGNLDRDAIYLNYTVDLGTVQYTTTDTLVARDRGVAMETFNFILQ